MENDAIHYQQTGRPVQLNDLVDTSKYYQLMEQINMADNIPRDVKYFCALAASRHLRFNYRNIAEYYCSASDDVRKLFESSGLVILDINDAIKNGYIKLQDDIRQIMFDQDVR